MFSILVQRSNSLPNKTFIYSKTVFFPSLLHTQQLTRGLAHLLFGRIHMLSSCWLMSLKGEKRNLPLSLSHSASPLFIFLFIFLWFFSSLALPLCWKSAQKSMIGPLCSTPGCSICHYEVFGFATWSQCTCVHMCVPVIAGIPHLLSLLFPVFTRHDLVL